ncbi:MAG: tRNA (adenosine(37)-N6)-threonylcarbamoyltransferase complex ATPase subunit type 1 TsaE [Lachnospiraceae bacterium]|nr:tRNA (adenosine(37)-N6)-threonylcarbamoyltransferase complex ATPase subunit type 1 TsaE [Lachnospiraceae bacterium]
MDVQVFQSYSVDDTFSFGIRLGESCSPGDIILLNGDLGVGKTVLSKGIGEGLGIQEPISSPTFTVLQIYEEGRMPLYHFDVYRITDVEEMEEIGYEDYFYGQGLCLVEWASLIEEILPDHAVSVTIEKDLEQGTDYRKITVGGFGRKMEA